MKKTDDCFRAALGYLDRGWAALALCPPGHQGVTDWHRTTCQHPAKRPLGRWKGWQSRLPTLEELAAQWEAVPGANVGVVTGRVSGLVGIDVDGLEGERLLQDASGDEGTPGTLTFTTARGRRLLYALEPGTVVRGWSIHRDECEVKVLGEGGLTVMPPSRHAVGVTYRWSRGRGPGRVALAAAPEWALRGRGPAEEVRTPGRLGTGPVVNGGTIPEGCRNVSLFRIGCAMRGRGSTEEEIFVALTAVNLRCRPPLNAAEVWEVSRSASRYQGSRRVRSE
jgi:hypothetical protein